MTEKKDKSLKTTPTDELNQVWEDFENAQSYQAKLGLTTDIPEYVAFKEGTQWPEATAKTKNMPRPIFNIVEMIVDTKIANVVNAPVKINYLSGSDPQKANKFTKFAEYQQKEMGMRAMNDQAAEDGAVKGTYVYHFYWDGEYAGKRGNYEGGLRCEIIDPLNIFFSNPNEIDEQKQEWIIISSRRSVEAVKKIADKGINLEKISSDESESYYDEEEQDDSDLCTLLLRYFRKNGEVYFERAVKGTIVNKPQPLNSALVKKEDIDRALGEMDTANISQPDSTMEVKEESSVNDFKANLYPIAVGRWKKRDKCIYGRGEVVGLIPNQKAVNFEVAMQLLNHQELGWGKLLAKANALDGQEPTNTPGEILYDHTPGNFWGIAKLEGSGFSAGALSLAPQIVDLTRMATNSSEIITGDMISKDLSGQAIAQLQAQSQKPYGRLKNNFYRTQEKIGKVLEQSYKLYYEEAEYDYELSPEEQRQTQEALQAAGRNEPIQAHVIDTFNGKDFQDTKFEVVVEAGAGTEYSEIQSMTILNNLLTAQLIDLKTYSKLYPETAMPFKHDLIEVEEAKERSMLTQLQQVVQQQAKQLEQMGNQMKQYDSSVKQLSSELSKSNSKFSALQNEYASKINAQNDYIQKMNQPKKETSKTTTADNKG